jgi:predicted nucleic acid-binding protein
MKIMTCFIDSSAWLAVIESNHPKHKAAKSYFQQLLEDNAKLYTNNIVIDKVLQNIKTNRSGEKARRFLNIIDESVLTINLRIDWISRRIRRTSINQYLKSSEKSLTLDHFYIQESLKRKHVDIIFSFDESLLNFGLPLMPQTA